MFRIGPRRFQTLVNIMNKSTTVEMHPAVEEINNANVSLPFYRAKISRFFQDRPELDNQYSQDTTLKTYLKRHVPEEVREMERFLTILSDVISRYFCDKCVFE